jgi:hypothetical protein
MCPTLLLTVILFFPGSHLEGYLPANPPFYALCVKVILFIMKNLKGLISSFVIGHGLMAGNIAR